jgi:hypothetical protein
VSVLLARACLFRRASLLLSAKHTQFHFTGNTCFDPYPLTCLYNDGAHYICCDSKECGPIGKDGNTPICRGSGITPSPNIYLPTPSPPSGHQGGKARKWAPQKALPSAQYAANWIQLCFFLFLLLDSKESVLMHVSQWSRAFSGHDRLSAV